MGVAATKTFTAQVVALAVFALRLAEARGSLAPERLSRLRDQLHALPSLAREFLEAAPPIEEIGGRAEKPFFLFLGRGVRLPVCA